MGNPLGMGKWGAGYYHHMADMERREKQTRASAKSHSSPSGAPAEIFNLALDEIRTEAIAWKAEEKEYGFEMDRTYEVNNILGTWGILPESLTQSQINRIKRAIS